jgi:hypothetical protein
MIRQITLCSFVTLFLGIAASGMAAVRSDIADAAMKSDKAALRLLLGQKADVNAAQVDGATALHWAMYRDDLEMTDRGLAVPPPNRVVDSICIVEICKERN